MKTIEELRNDIAHAMTIKADIKEKEYLSWSEAKTKANKVTHKLYEDLKDLIIGFKEIYVQEIYLPTDLLTIVVTCCGKSRTITPRIIQRPSPYGKTNEFSGYTMIGYGELLPSYSEHEIPFVISLFIKSALLN